jgi:acyl carrier protein
MGRSPATILQDLTELLRDMTDWDYPAEITRDTRFFADLAFESIDAVVLGEAIETRYRRRFPYAEFLRDLGERGERDLQLGELVDFLSHHLDAPPAAGPSEPAS